MRRNLCLWLGVVLCAGGCGGDIKNFADQHVQNDMLARHKKTEAIPFLESKGTFYDQDGTTHVDREIVLPLLRRLKELAPTEQWAMLRPEKADSAYGMLIELPGDAQLVDRMAEAVQEADDQFSGLILQQWGHKWLLIDLIDKESYEFLKQSDPNIDKQR